MIATKMQRVPRATAIGSIQQRFVPVRAVHDHVLVTTSANGTPSYLTVLQVEGISFHLKSDDEQELLIDRYQAVLCALPGPIQILWRILPLNWNETIRQLVPSSQESSEELEEEQDGLWEPLIAASTASLGNLAQARTLLDRKMYLIVRVNETTGAGRAMRLRWKKRKKPVRTTARSQAKALAHARHQLDIQVEEVTRLLAALNLTVRRLSGVRELAPFYASCLCQQQAERSPLLPEWIDGIGQPVSRIQQGGSHPIRWARTRHPAQPETSVMAGRGFPRLADLVAPAAITIAPDRLRIDYEDAQHPEYVRVISVAQLPRRVPGGFLKQLALLDEPLEVSFHLVPQDSTAMMHQFRVQQARHLSSMQIDTNKGGAKDPQVKVAEGDISGLIDRIASGEERMLDVSMLLLLRGASEQELNERQDRVMSVLRSMMIKARVALFNQERGFLAGLPYGRNVLGEGMLLSATATATMFHFLNNSLVMSGGVLEGVTPQGDPILIDRWGEGLPNANCLVLGIPGSGKSFGTKLQLLHTVLMHITRAWRRAQRQGKPADLPCQFITIDAEREFTRLTRALGSQGQVIRLAPGSAHQINPFDLPHMAPSEQARGNRLADHIQKLHTLLEIMLADRAPGQTGQLKSEEKGLLDRCLFETYRKVGVTNDPKTHDRPAPLMRDLYEVLESAVCGPDPTGLGKRLERFVTGSLAGLFSGPTNVSLDRLSITFDIHDLEPELHPVGLFLVANFVWTTSLQSRIPRMLIIDEAATLYDYVSGARFLEDIVRRARKYYVGVVIITQHPGIFRESAIPANCAMHILTQQDATSLGELREIFHLSEQEERLLHLLPIGEALMLVGEKRIHIRYVANLVEYILATTHPRDLATWQQEAKYQYLRPMLDWVMDGDPEDGDLDRENEPDRQSAQGERV